MIKSILDIFRSSKPSDNLISADQNQNALHGLGAQGSDDADDTVPLEIDLNEPNTEATEGTHSNSEMEINDKLVSPIDYDRLGFTDASLLADAAEVIAFDDGLDDTFVFFGENDKDDMFSKYSAELEIKPQSHAFAKFDSASDIFDFSSSADASESQFYTEQSDLDANSIAILGLEPLPQQSETGRNSITLTTIDDLQEPVSPPLAPDTDL